LANKVRLVILIAVAAGAGAIILSARGPAPREIHLVGRNTTFYVEGLAEPNPVLHVRPGETIRVVFRNSEPGMRHDFTIPEWGVESAVVAGVGETTVTFKAPERGRAEYNCTPHAAVMKGTITVE
jgi:plastocyanin